ncbi:MAG: M20/M25/M40 family metallo-hydrolase [Bosea sp.]|nr:M20/M25/M40 family metallo-hydrolase [Bosea sp. (in: a-proteobacteria)]
MSDLRTTILDWIKQDEDELVQFYRDFVKARSPNPPGDTREAIGFVADRLTEWKIGHDVVFAKDKEHLPNIVADFDTGKPGRHLVLNGHADVFPIGNPDSWERDPWCGDVVDGRVFGRGSTDMKPGTTVSRSSYLRSCAAAASTAVFVSLILAIWSSPNTLVMGAEQGHSGARLPAIAEKHGAIRSSRRSS